MIKRLKSLEQIKKENDFTLHIDGSIDIFINENNSVFINKEMFDYFGKEIYVINNPIIQSDYHYCALKRYDNSDYWYFHKDWFEPENLLEDELFEV